MFASLPYLGVGLSYRWELNAALFQDPGAVDWLEITPEHFMPATPDSERRLQLLKRRFPTVGHSLELSVGSEVDANSNEDRAYRAELLRVLDAGGCTWHGDHLCYSQVGKQAVRLLSPLPFHEEALTTSVRNIRTIQSQLPVPFVIENITYYFANPLSEMSEVEFICRLLADADCGLILDLHNLMANSQNHHYDPYSFLDALPLERVVQIHLAGGQDEGGLRLDTHSNCSPQEVWSLLSYVAPRCPVRGINFEMDADFPPFGRIAQELAHARDILTRCGAPAA